MYKRMIMVPEERWNKMLETYDALVLELEKMKNALEATATSHKSQHLLGLKGGAR